MEILKNYRNTLNSKVGNSHILHIIISFLDPSQISGYAVTQSLHTHTPLVKSVIDPTTHMRTRTHLR